MSVDVLIASLREIFVDVSSDDVSHIGNEKENEVNFLLFTTRTVLLRRLLLGPRRV